MFFQYKNIIAVPAASFVNDLRSLRTIKAVFVRKEEFDAACVLKDDLEVDERIEVGCKIKETLFIQELQPSLNANVGSERLLLY